MTQEARPLATTENQRRDTSRQSNILVRPAVLPLPALPPWVWRLAYGLSMGLAWLISSLYIFVMWAMDTRDLINLNAYERAKFIPMIYGTAHRPFVQRVLIPWTVRAILRLMPRPWLDFLHGEVYNRFPVLWKITYYMPWERDRIPEYLVALVLMYAALVGFMFAARSLYRRLYRGPSWLGELVPLAMVWTLPIFFIHGTHYIYDFPLLFLFTLGFLLLAEERWGWFYPVFFLGLLNKETTALLSLFFVLRFWPRLPRREFWLHCLLQGVMIFGLRVYLALRFRHNPGSFLEWHLPLNLLNALLRPYPLTTVLSIAALVLLVGHDWRGKPLALRQGLIVSLPIALSYMFIGIYQEIRIFYEAYPIVFMLALPTLTQVLGWKLIPAQAHESSTCMANQE